MKRCIRRNRGGGRKFTNRTFRRRSFARRSTIKRKRSPAWTIVKPLYMGDCAKLKMRYTDQGSLTNVTGNPRLVFRGNSIWDPDFALGGQTVMGWQAWNQFYLRYRVLGSAIRMTFASTNDAANRGNITCAVVPVSNTAQLDATLVQSKQLPYAKVRSTQQGANVVTIKNYISTAKVEGIPWNAPKIAAAYSAAMNANPDGDFTWFWAVTWGPMNGTAIISVDFDVTITYYVELFDRRVLPQGQSLDDIENEDGTYDPIELSNFLATHSNGLGSPFYHGPKAHKNFVLCQGKRKIQNVEPPADNNSQSEKCDNQDDEEDSSEQTLTENPPDEEFANAPAVLVKPIVKKPDQKTLDGTPIITPAKKRAKLMK